MEASRDFFQAILTQINTDTKHTHTNLPKLINSGEPTIPTTPLMPDMPPIWTVVASKLARSFATIFNLPNSKSHGTAEHRPSTPTCTQLLMMTMTINTMTTMTILMPQYPSTSIDTTWLPHATPDANNNMQPWQQLTTNSTQLPDTMTHQTPTMTMMRDMPFMMTLLNCHLEHIDKLECNITQPYQPMTQTLTTLISNATTQLPITLPKCLSMIPTLASPHNPWFHPYHPTMPLYHTNISLSMALQCPALFPMVS